MAAFTHTIHKMPGLTVEIKVQFSREFRLRLWLACQLMRFAGWVLGGRVNVEINGETQ